MREKKGLCGASSGIVILLSIMLLIFSVMPVYANEADSENGEASSGLPPKKIVSIVFDDSYSMGSDWLDANYATQVFAALLNPRDDMYLTYMSEELAGKADLSDVDEAIRKVREKEYNASGTPLNSVDVAYDALAAIQETDPETQFWLVVMTDGGFSRDSSRFEDLDDAFMNLKGKVMSNGSPLHIYYFGIGSTAAQVNPDISNYLEAISSEDIVGTLGNVANTISGRLVYDKSAIIQVDDRTVKIESSLPLYSLTAFTQRSEAQVTSAKLDNTEQSDVPLTYTNHKVKHPDFDPDEGFPEEKNNLKGNVSVITKEKKVIPAGTYTITFSEAVDPDAAVLMYQPAIGLQLQVIREGTVITDYTDIHENDNLEIHLTAVDPVSGKEIDQANFPADTKWEIRMDKGGTVSTEEGLTAFLQDVDHEKYTVRGSMTIPGMPPVYTDLIAFMPTDDPMAFSIDPEKDTGVVPRSKIRGAVKSSEAPVVWIDRDEDKNNDGVLDGNPVHLSKEETTGTKNLIIKEIRMTPDDFGFILNRAGRIKANLELRQREDGAFVLCPATRQKRWFLLTLLAPYAIRTGHYEATIELEINGKSQDLKVDVKGGIKDWIPLIVEIIVFLILKRLWYVLFRKPKFARGYALDLSVYVRSPDGFGSISPAQNEQINLNPYGDHPLAKKPAEKRISTLQITVFADVIGNPYIETKTVYQGGSWGASTVNEKRGRIKFDNVVKVIKKQTKNRAEGLSDEAEMHILTADATYFYDDGNQLYTLKLMQR